MDRLGGFANHSTEWLAQRTFTSTRSAQRWRLTGRAPRVVVAFLRLVEEGPLGMIHAAWNGWRLHRGALISPEGIAFAPAELLALTLRLQQVAELAREVRVLKQQQTAMLAAPSATPAEIRDVAAELAVLSARLTIAVDATMRADLRPASNPRTAPTTARECASP